MQISHIEVRRHPILQRELRQETLVEGPHGAISPRGRLILGTVVGMVLLATLLVRAG